MVSVFSLERKPLHDKRATVNYICDITDTKLDWRASVHQNIFYDGSVIYVQVIALYAAGTGRQGTIRRASI